MTGGYKRYYRNDITLDRVRKLIDYDPETGEFTRKATTSKKIRPGGKAGGINVNGYKVVSLDGRVHLAHRIAWLVSHERWPEHDLDHINGDRSDCRLRNLREATPYENLWNRTLQRNNKSGHKNVSWSKPVQKWEVRLRRNGRQIIIGYFDDLEEAARMATEARLKYHGDFAR